MSVTQSHTQSPPSQYPNRSVLQLYYLHSGGTGAAPVVAETAHDLGILTVGIVTKPFAFEGKRKMAQAEQGIASPMMHVDSLIVIPNERLKLISQEKITLMNAFEAADNVLRQGTKTAKTPPKAPAPARLNP